MMNPSTTPGAPAAPPGEGVLYIMGVAACGKSTVGRAVAGRLGWTYIEGDSLHPPSNVRKMESGHRLTDADREPWLDRVREAAGEAVAGGGAVAACSALKASYRRRLAERSGAWVTFVYLRITPEEAAARMAGRQHFFPLALLASQFDDLEEPTAEEAAMLDAGLCVLDATRPVAELVERVACSVGQGSP